ncbi:carbohydrate ABC transporter permease [Mycetocola sp.]|uniref:carbohydrate ABC transporter permease n=1 Tax=Mycetocola sp. TaxID=1871042 RepID=UPI003989DEEB
MTSTHRGSAGRLTTPGGLARVRPALYVAPGVILLMVWIYAPLLLSVVLSFADWQLTGSSEFVGLENYARLFTDDTFWVASGQTVLYALLLLPFATIVPLLLAVMLWQRASRFTHLYRAVIFLPMMVAPVALGVSWQFILTPLNGLVNEVLASFGIAGSNWLGDPATSLASIVVITSAKVIAMNFLLYSAALAGLRRNLLDAARLDNATALDTTIHVIVPQLKGTVVLLGCLSLITAGQWAFNNISILTQGGPSASSDNIYYTIYRMGFTFFEMGEASAASVVLLLAVVAVAVLVQAGRRIHARRSV